MKAQLAAVEFLRQPTIHWLTWTEITTVAIDHGEESECSALETLGVHSIHGACNHCFRAWSATEADAPPPCDRPMPRKPLRPLPPSALHPPDLAHGRSWASVYSALGVKRHSPFAVLLDFPALLALAVRLRNPCDTTSARQRVIVHAVGVSREAPLLPHALNVLPHLLPRGVDLDLALVGPELPALPNEALEHLARSCAIEALTDERRAFSSAADPIARQIADHHAARGDAGPLPPPDTPTDPRDKATVRLLGAWREEYTLTRALELGRGPDIIVMPNAGLPVYPGWARTLRDIGGHAWGDAAPLVVCTDYCEEAAIHAQGLLRLFLDKDVFEPYPWGEASPVHPLRGDPALSAMGPSGQGQGGEGQQDGSPPQSLVGIRDPEWDSEDDAAWSSSGGHWIRYIEGKSTLMKEHSGFEGLREQLRDPVRMRDCRLEESVPTVLPRCTTEVPGVFLNPFRGVVSLRGKDNLLPSYSNGFLVVFQRREADLRPGEPRSEASPVQKKPKRR